MVLISVGNIIRVEKRWVQLNLVKVVACSQPLLAYVNFN